MEKVSANFFPVLLLAYILLAIWVGAAVRLVCAIFFASVRKQVIAHPFLHGIWFLVALLATAALLLPSYLLRPEPVPRVNRMIAVLEVACKAYQTEYGSFPSGDNAAITEALHGSNPRNIAFIEFRSTDTNSLGQVIDPWGTPYRFILQDKQSPLIKSAGPDRTFDSKDDFSSSSR